ncbi:hypothetical protein H4R19_007134, partial [Coemansia spiralis]
MPPPANPPSPPAVSSTSTSSTPLTMAAPRPHSRYQPPASPQLYGQYDLPLRPAFHHPQPHTTGPVRHSPPLYARQGRFSPIDPPDIPHPHLHQRHLHRPADAQPQLLHSPSIHPPRPPLHQAPMPHHPGAMPHPNYRHHHQPPPSMLLPPPPPPQQRRSPFMHKAERPAPAGLLGRMAAPTHHRPYDVQPPAPTSRTFWNHYETGLLVDLWLDFEPQFLANKRNAGVWALLARRLTEQSGRHRTVRECRIKWKNMWAKHR